MKCLGAAVVATLVIAGPSACTQIQKASTSMFASCEKVEEYYGNGNLKERGCKNDSTWVGVHEKWYLSGHSALKEHWKDGKREGEYVNYDEYGNTLLKGSLLDGKKHGEWLDGRLSQEFPSRVYYENGKCVRGDCATVAIYEAFQF